MPETKTAEETLEIEYAESSPNSVAIVGGNTPRATWNFSADHVKQNIAQYSARTRSALWWFFHYALEEDMRRDDAAKLVGVSDTTLYRIYSDKYRQPGTGERIPPSEQLVKAIEDLRVRVAKAREIAGREYVETETSARIWALCDRVRARNQTGIIWGESHIGKTRALEEYAHNHNHGTSKYVRMPTGSGKYEVARLIANACGVSDGDNYVKLKDRIIRSLDATNLIIFDELHLVAYTYSKAAKWAVIELLREIHDRTKCAMVAAATHVGREDMYKSADAHFYRQFLNRSPHKVELGSEPTRKDLQAFVAAFGFPYPRYGSDEEKTLREIGKSSGVLALIEVLTMAQTKAKRGNLVADIAHVVDAWEYIKNEARIPSFA